MVKSKVVQPMRIKKVPNPLKANRLLKAKKVSFNRLSYNQPI